MNYMLHIAAITQLRLDTDGRVCCRRKRAEGKRPLEAIGCLKRRISDHVYRQLVADAQRAAGTGPGGAEMTHFAEADVRASNVPLAAQTSTTCRAAFLGPLGPQARARRSRRSPRSPFRRDR